MEFGYLVHCMNNKTKLNRFNKGFEHIHKCYSGRENLNNFVVYFYPQMSMMTWIRIRSCAHHQRHPKHSGQTQGWRTTAIQKGPPSCVERTPSPALLHPVGDSILQSIADSLLYTGIPLTEFHTLVSCLKTFSLAFHRHCLLWTKS